MITRAYPEAKKLSDDAVDLLEALKSSSVITHDQWFLLFSVARCARDRAMELDRAVEALEFYADPKTWTEAPANTTAAQDLGRKAKLALVAIDPV